MTAPVSRDARAADYLERLAAAGDLPALGEQLQAILDVLRNEDTSMQALANIVLRDYSLTLKVLRTANSFHYNRTGRQILSVT